MAWLQENEHCPSCNMRHDFIYKGNDLVHGDLSYNFTCPETNKKSSIQFELPAEETYAAHPDAVVVTKP